MITILHNPRCSKSRAGVALLEEKGVEFEILKYLDDPLTPDELESIIEKLGISAHDLIRKNEEVYKNEFADKELTDEEWVLAMLEHPRLIERPIVVNGDKAVIGRPTEVIETIL
ncbi:arsenate reductase (glutaredoxin) [Carboxylicivirga sediminis]|uniref:Arsenate reductase (Glutaredoxin) n=1 Tax=Carboxylicivirga sediminis TaxID=2006564 RepID=A0A941IYI4_9BACT|nr:arsenate reductase (glutaredoxin) [Carboxylicivirga sediminis]MBR8537030.1 arsenate reductase (glutaredoxin) [Carboxylicivirga sediminis]